MSQEQEPEVLPPQTDEIPESPEAVTQAVSEPAPPAPSAEELARDLQDQLLRLRADFENFRKRTRREKEEWTVRSLEHICGDLLPVMDSFELGLKNAADVEMSADVRKGFQLVRDQLRNVLGKYGLSDVEAENQAFDPNLHEAIAQVPSPDLPAGAVIAVARRGYKLGERLLRPAQVVVSMGAPEPAPEPAEPVTEEA